MADQLTSLHRYIIEHYNLEELRTLCFELGVNYDDLGGEGLSAKVRELILKMGRQRELERLMHALRRERAGLFDQAGLSTQVEALHTLYEELSAPGVGAGLAPSRYRYLAVGVVGALIVALLAVVVFNRTGDSGRADMPQADITLAGGVAGGGRGDGELSLEYRYSRDQEQVHIDYGMPYLDLLANGGPIPATESGPGLFDWQFPTLAVKIVNNTDDTLFLTEAAVEVKSSEINTEPVLMVEPSGAYDRFRFWNEGWGKVVDPVLAFDVLREDRCEDEDLWPVMGHTLQLESFLDAARDVVVTDFIPPEILDVQSLESRAILEPTYACVPGTLAYRSESGRDYVVKFKVVIQLAGPIVKPPVFASFEYDLFLEAGRSGYTQPLSLSQAIKAGEAEQFSITIGTDKSADFDLAFSFRTSTGAAISANGVGLRIFVPRAAAPHDVGAGG